jgi:hypothetical protein
MRKEGRSVLSNVDVLWAMQSISFKRAPSTCPPRQHKAQCLWICDWLLLAPQSFPMRSQVTPTTTTVDWSTPRSESVRSLLPGRRQRRFRMRVINTRPSHRRWTRWRCHPQQTSTLKALVRLSSHSTPFPLCVEHVVKRHARPSAVAPRGNRNDRSPMLSQGGTESPPQSRPRSPIEHSVAPGAEEVL